MSSKPSLRLGPDETVAEGVLERRHAVSSLIGEPGDTLFVSGLAGSEDAVEHVAIAEKEVVQQPAESSGLFAALYCDKKDNSQHECRTNNQTAKYGGRA